MKSYSVMLKLCTGRIVECEFDTQKIKFPASLITVNTQSLTINTVEEIIMCMILTIKPYVCLVVYIQTVIIFMIECLSIFASHLHQSTSFKML
jgi:hypothetical protein